jgi:hypothetical protein
MKKLTHIDVEWISLEGVVKSDTISVRTKQQFGKRFSQKRAEVQKSVRSSNSLDQLCIATRDLSHKWFQ